MRFSVCLKTHEPFDDLVEVAAHAERTGWDGVWYTDHLLAGAGVPRPEAWMTLAALAARVPRVRLGPLVTGNTFRHPAVLAKMAATLDHISGGRLVLGLGSAWAENEHRQYGIPYYTVPERLRRLDEACTVIKLLFSQAVSDFDGRYYQLDGATLEPKPVQNPLPLLIGGGGEKVTLRITAKHADEWNIYGSVETLKRKMRILDQHCANVGRRADRAGLQPRLEGAEDRDDGRIHQGRGGTLTLRIAPSSGRRHRRSSIGQPDRIRALLEYLYEGAERILGVQIEVLEARAFIVVAEHPDAVRFEVGPRLDQVVGGARDVMEFFAVLGEVLADGPLSRRSRRYEFDFLAAEPEGDPVEALGWRCSGVREQLAAQNIAEQIARPVHVQHAYGDVIESFQHVSVPI